MPTPPDPFFGSPGADAHLLAAAALGTRWSVSRTYDESNRLASECQRASLRHRGLPGRLRDFERRQGVAVQAVAEFADRASARRADAVLLAWRDQCADRLRTRDAALGTVRHGQWVSLVEATGVRFPAAPARGGAHRGARHLLRCVPDRQRLTARGRS